jgi:protocatechuate 3,4-dioxygenase beta subunit
MPTQSPRYALILAALIAAGAVPPAAALDLTPSQTEGPYYPLRKPADIDPDLTRLGNGPQAKGEVLVLKGQVVDPAGKALAGAKVEIWQADAGGAYLHPRDPRTNGRDQAFQFYGETLTDASGAFGFRTIVPGEYDSRPRHIHARIIPPGGRPLTTQFYIRGDQRLAGDGIAASLGKSLASLLLEPKKTAADGALEASITVVVRAR